MLKLFSREAADPHKALIAVLGEHELPSFPAIITSALEKIRDEDAALSSISDLVSSDPGLTVRLLGTVNSAAFALRHKVDSIHHAVSLLGRNQLEALLISMGVRESLTCETGPGYDAARFWTTAARRAATGRALAELIDPSTCSESFTASLLQDLAVPILSLQKGPEYGQLLQHWHNSDEDLAQLEQSAYGWNHADIGACLCRAWEFPSALALAIGTHHGDDVEGDGSMPAVGLVAPLREVDEELGVEQLVATAHDRYGIPEDQTRGIVRDSFEAAEEIARMFT